MRFALIVCCALTFSAPLVACTITPIVTMARYNQVSNGMTYQEVVDAMGKEGKEVARSGSGDNEIVTYSWVNSDGTNMTATFQGGKMVSKVQIGLK